MQQGQLPDPINRLAEAEKARMSMDGERPAPVTVRQKLKVQRERLEQQRSAIDQQIAAVDHALDRLESIPNAEDFLTTLSKVL